MATHDEELLKAARVLLKRQAGQRGRLPTARIRRSISTTYYALFHFLLDEVGRQVVGTSNVLRTRRRLMTRTVSHAGLKLALEKVSGANVNDSIAEFMRHGGAPGPVPTPRFMRNLARAFSDAHTKRRDADYNLDEVFSEADARLLRGRVRQVIRGWRAATAAEDRDAKHALCMLVVLKGQLRADQ